jgi:3-deoxy-manno-octulosonate cytidylyltransferase (CMP-KDO synthetase)
MNVVIIPARWHSTRFPGKPLHVIAGKPLLRHVWDRCRRAATIERVIIATDDHRIADVVAGWKAEVSLTSRRHQSGTDRIAEVVRAARKLSIIVNVQGDEPLVDPLLIDRMVRLLQQNRQYQIVTAAHRFANPADALSPHQVKVVTDLFGTALYFSRAAIPFARETNRNLKFLRHQGIYGFRRNALLRFVNWRRSPLERTESLEQLRALENGVRVHVLITKHGSPGVDTPADAAAIADLLTKPDRDRWSPGKSSSSP